MSGFVGNLTAYLLMAVPFAAVFFWGRTVALRFTGSFPWATALFGSFAVFATTWFLIFLIGDNILNLNRLTREPGTRLTEALAAALYFSANLAPVLLMLALAALGVGYHFGAAARLSNSHRTAAKDNDP